jgi:Galactose oxidase, central domain/Kelch motif
MPTVATATASPLPQLPLPLVLQAWACLEMPELAAIRSVSATWNKAYLGNVALLRSFRRAAGTLQPYAFIVQSHDCALVPVRTPSKMHPVLGPLKTWESAFPTMASNPEGNLVVCVGECRGPGRETCCNLYDFSYGPPPRAQMMPMMPTSHDMCAAVWTDQNELFVTGGAPSAEELENKVYKFSFSTQKWSTVAPMLVARCRHSAIWLPTVRKVLVMGGYVTDTCELYDPELNQWEAAASMARPRWRFAKGILPGTTDTVLIAGGNANATDEYTEAWCTAEAEVVFERYHLVYLS